MSGKYQKEQLEIEARLKEVTETLNESYEKSQGIRDFLSLIRNYQGLKELDATVKQEIKIYYKFIGFVGQLHITPTKRWTALPVKHCPHNLIEGIVILQIKCLFLEFPSWQNKKLC